MKKPLTEVRTGLLRPIKDAEVLWELATARGSATLRPKGQEGAWRAGVRWGGETFLAGALIVEWCPEQQGSRGKTPASLAFHPQASSTGCQVSREHEQCRPGHRIGCGGCRTDLREQTEWPVHKRTAWPDLPLMLRAHRAREQRRQRS